MRTGFPTAVGLLATIAPLLRGDGTRRRVPILILSLFVEYII